MTEVEKLVERLNEGADIDALLMEAARRVEELEAALGKLIGNLDHDGGLDLDGYTREALEEARSALSEGSGSSRELAPPDESGNACGATERAEG